MPWYKTGTVTATNNSGTLTGVGTAFLSNIRVGDGVTIAGSTSVHEVTAITSETQITVSPVYAGTTGSGKAFGIVPVQGYVKDLADQAKALILSFTTVGSSNSVLALANVTGAADRLPYFTSGTAMGLATFTATARTLLDDTSVAAMRTTLGLKTAALADLVGTATAGAVFETGSNANGSYVKFQDGTMLCWRLYTAAIAMSNYGSMYMGTVTNVPLPATFVGTWSGSAGGVDSNTAGMASIYPTATNSFYLYYFSAAPSHATTLISIIATGRWK